MPNARPPKAKVIRGADSVKSAESRPKATFFHVQCGLVHANIDDLPTLDACICCGAEADSQRVIGTCKRCRVHQLAYSVIMFTIGLLVLGAGFYSIDPLSHWWPTFNAKLLAASVFGLGAAISALCIISIFLARPSSRHTHWGSPIDSGEEFTILFNAELASKLAQEHSFESETIRRSRVNLLTLFCLFFVFPAIPATIAYTKFDTRHVTLHVDNGLDSEISIVSGERELFVVAAHSAQKVYLVRTPMLLRAIGPQGHIDDIELVPNRSDTHGSEIRIGTPSQTFIWNVDQRNCYIESTFYYANQSWNSSVEEVTKPNFKLFSTKADFVLELAPEILEVNSVHPSETERVRRQLLSAECVD